MQLRRVIRLDSVPMQKAYFTPEGFLKDKPVLTSTGIFEYANPDGSIRRELRLPEDVFSPESLKSYRGKPIVVTHDAGLIDKDNVAENQIGTILSEGERSGDDVRAEIIIHDTDAMKDSGYKELSLGYNLDLEETPGEWNGQRYDAVQRNIRINHLALVREARAGEQARLNMDGRDQKNVLKGGKQMSKKITKTRHGDSVLSQEEFEKAIDEYKMRKAQREQTDADDVVEEEEKAVEEIKDRNPNDIEAQLAEVKARRDRRDEAGDPEDMEGAMSVIAHQDEDIDTLYDIIDTLLAKQDFDAAEPEVEEVAEEEEVIDDEENKDGFDKMDKLKGDADEEEESIEEEEVKEDADEDLEDVEDEDVVEEEEIKEDADDEEPAEEEVVEEKDEWEEDGDDCGAKKERMDSAISRSVRNHMIMGNIGRQVGLKNLEMKDLRDAKIAIIKKVRPDMRLDGKSDAYINGAFESARKTIKASKTKDTSYQKRQMFNKDSRDEKVEKNSAEDARERMIARMYKK